MPYIGLPPFLHFEKFFENWELKDCVNALYRASPISTAHMKISQQQAEMCQCPISGFPHFYEMMKVLSWNVIKVSMPYIGLPPFLPTPDPVDPEPTPCVNALYRASPISTCSKSVSRCSLDVSMPYIGLPPFLLYPFKNPLKSMVSGAVFRG